MSTHLGKTDAPPAARAATSGWRDPRLWIGVALVAASVLIGARVLGAADDTIEVWSARADLPPGEQVSESDLVVRRVHFDGDDADLYLRSDKGLPDQRTLTRGVGAGELLPKAALGAADGDIEKISVSVTPANGANLAERGAQLNVWIAPLETGDPKDSKSSEPLLEDVTVLAVHEPDESFGSTAEVLVDLAVKDPDQVDLGALLAAHERVQFTR